MATLALYEAVTLSRHHRPWCNSLQLFLHRNLRTQSNCTSTPTDASRWCGPWHVCTPLLFIVYAVLLCL